MDDNTNVLDGEYIKNLGILGSLMQKQSDAIDEINDSLDSFFLENDRKESSGGIVSRDGLVHEDPDKRMVDMFRTLESTTLNVKVNNFVSGLLRPMMEQFEDLNYSDSELMLDSKRVIVDRLDRVLIALNQLKSESVTFFDSSVGFFGKTFNTLRFIKEHPGLTALKTFGATMGVLFGKDRDSDTQKIVRSNDRVTEAIINGQVDDRESVWETFRRGGLLKLTARGVAGMLGGEEQAQNRKDARELGMEVDNSIVGKLVDNFYASNLINKSKDTLYKEVGDGVDEIAPNNGTNVNGALLNTALEHLNTILPNMERSVLTMERPPFFSTMNDIMTGSFIRSSVVVDNQKANEVSEREQKETLFRETQETIMSSVDRNSGKTFKTMKEMNSRQEDIHDQNKNIVKWSKGSVKEQIKTRRLMQIKTILGFLGGVVSTLVTTGVQIVSSITSSAATVVAAIAGFLGIKKILKDGFAKIGTLLSGLLSKLPVIGKFFGKPATSVAGAASAGTATKAAPKMSSLGRAGGVLTAGLYAYEGWSEKAAELEERDDLNSTQKTIQKTGNAAGSGLGGLAGAYAGASTGASVGATIGTFFGPGVGTAIGAGIGGVVGSVAGGIAGSEIGQFVGDKLSSLVSGFFGDDEKTIGDKLQEKTDALSESMDAFKEKSAGFFSDTFDTVSKWYSGAKSFLFDDEKTITEQLQEKTENLSESMDTFKEKSEGFFSTAFGTVTKWYRDAKGFLFDDDEKTISNQLQEKTENLSESMDTFKEKSEGFFSSAFGTVTKWYRDAKGFLFDDDGVVDNLGKGTDELRHSINKNTENARDIADRTIDTSRRLIDAALDSNQDKNKTTGLVSASQFDGDVDDIVYKGAVERHNKIVSIIDKFSKEKDDENSLKLKRIQAEYDTAMSRYRKVPKEIKEVSEGFFSRLWDGIKSVFESAASWISGVTGNMWNTAKRWFHDDKETPEFTVNKSTNELSVITSGNNRETQIINSTQTGKDALRTMNGDVSSISFVPERMGMTQDSRQHDISSTQGGTVSETFNESYKTITKAVDDIKNAVIQFTQVAYQQSENVVSKFENTIEENDFMNVTGR